MPSPSIAAKQLRLTVIPTVLRIWRLEMQLRFSRLESPEMIEWE